MNCGKCGAPIVPGNQFCNNCGAPVNVGYQSAMDMRPVRPIGFGEAIRNYFTQYATFTGRATRSEYWFVTLFNFLVQMAISVVLGFVLPDVATILSGLYSLAVLIPGLALAWRRLHDIGKAGTWYLMALIPLVGWIFVLVYFCTASGPNNEYGPRKV